MSLHSDMTLVDRIRELKAKQRQIMDESEERLKEINISLRHLHREFNRTSDERIQRRILLQQKRLFTETEKALERSEQINEEVKKLLVVLFRDDSVV